MKTKTTAFMTSNELMELEIEMNQKLINELEIAFNILLENNMSILEVATKQLALSNRNNFLRQMIKRNK